MSLERNLFLLFAITTFAVASIILSVFNYNPFESTSVALINFYVSFLISLAGIGAITIYYARIKLSKNETIFLYFWPSVRQGFFFATAITILLYLQSLRILDWLIGLSIIIVTVLMELFFESKRHP